MPRRTIRLFVPVILLIAQFAAAQAAELVPASAPRGAGAVIAGGTGLDDPELSVTFADTAGARVVARVLARTAALIELEVPFSASTGPVHLLRGTTVVRTFSFALAADPAFVRVATLLPAATRQISGVSATNDGTVYTADRLNHCILAVTPAGDVSVVAGTGSPGWTDGAAASAQFHAPEGVAFDRTRDVLYVADTLNHCIRKIAGGVVTTLAGSGKPADGDGAGAAASFRQPAGLAIDAAGNLYVADTLNHKIRKVTPEGMVTTVAGNGRPSDRDGLASDAGFHEPAGIAWSTAGVLFVADTKNNVVRKVEAGQVSTVAGARRAGFADGPAHLAEFHHLEGIAVSESGAVYIADTQNHRIRKLELLPGGAMVTTVAGNGSIGLTDGAPGSATFNRPSAIVSEGALYVADRGDGAIRVIEPEVRLTDIYARRGPLGGRTIRVFGAGFVPGRTTVTAGHVVANITDASSTHLVAEIPPGSAGAIDVSVTTPSGTATLASAFAYLDPPRLTSVQPRKGSSAGGEHVTLRGSDFVLDGSLVRFGTRLLIDGAVTDAIALNGTTSIGTTIEGRIPPGEHGAAGVSVITDGGEASLADGYHYFDPPAISAFGPAQGAAGTQVTISGAHFDPDIDGNQVSIGSASAQVLSASESQLVIVVPSAAPSGRITITTAGGSVTSDVDFIVPSYESLVITPAVVSIEAGDSVQFEANGILPDGTSENITGRVAWSSANPSIVSITPAGLALGQAAGTTTISATFASLSQSATVTVIAQPPLPPDPATVAPHSNVPVSFADSIRFLYSGSNPIQRDVAPGAVVESRVSAIRGRVLDRNGQPLSGVKIALPSAPQLGSTLSRSDGWFDFAVNGGGPVTLQYTRNGYLAAQRTLTAQWQQSTIAPEVVLVRLDSAVTTIDLTNTTTVQVARGSEVVDANGARRATLLFEPGTNATLEIGGTSQPIGMISVRATEYTVGPDGERAMPASLPPQSAYTYCVELSVDEAIAANADSVRFTKPVAVYVENFLGMPVGEHVPVGYYDRKKAVWVPSSDGRVITILAENGGMAAVDTNGDGQADDPAILSQHAITEGELRRLAELYDAGQSLWRVQLTHFTPYDFNWAQILAAYEALNPDIPEPEIDIHPDERCPVDGSIIDCRGQTLGEVVGITGTPYSLQYLSSQTPSRVAGRTMTIRLTKATAPQTLVGVELSIEIAGQQIKKTYAALPNLEETFTWDGKDAYGRTLLGGHNAKVVVTYVYTGVYVGATRSVSFGLTEPTGIRLVASRAPARRTQELNVVLDQFDSRSAGLGGWVLDVNHTLDVTTNSAYYGSGNKRTSDTLMGTIRTVAGIAAISCGVCFSAPTSIAFLPDGSYYAADSRRIWKVSPLGSLTLVFGRTSTFDGNGGPAILASGMPDRLAVGPDGSVYFSEPASQTIRRIDPSGIVDRFAGRVTMSGPGGFSGDGGSALNAEFSSPRAIYVGPDGAVYVLDSGNRRIRRIGTDGVITTVAGNGTDSFSGDGGPAQAAGLAGVADFAIASDGSLYIVSVFSDAIRRVRTDGIIETYTILPRSGPIEPAFGVFARQIATAPDGALYVSDLRRIPGEDHFSVRGVAPDGTSTLIADGPAGDNHYIYTDQFFAGDGGSATQARYYQPAGIAVGPDWNVYVIDSFNRRIRRIAVSSRLAPSGDTQFARQDGSGVDIFDKRGRHLRTVHPWTGVPLLSFDYDVDGRLTGVTDAATNRTLIERNAEGTPTAIVAPGGQRTSFAVDANGYLSSITNPAGETISLEHTATGLLVGLTKPRGGKKTFAYGADGRLSRDADASDGFQDLTLSRSGSDYSTTRTTALGRSTSYGTSIHAMGETRTKTLPWGQNVTSLLTPQRVKTTTTPNGMKQVVTTTGDLRFGLQSPVVSAVQITTPAGLTWSMSRTQQITRSSSTNPFSVTSFTDRVTINGKTTTSVYNASARRVTLTTPAGRTSTSTMDLLGRPVSLQWGTLAPTNVSYDAAGRVAQMSSGSRSLTFGYNERNEVVSVTDPLSRTVRFTYDASGRIVTHQNSDGHVTSFTYDTNGNLKSIRPPGRSSHQFTFTVADQVDTYAPPSGGSAPVATTYEYDGDGELKGIVRPDGRMITLGHDGGGRLVSVSADADARTIQYDGTTGNVGGVTGGDVSNAYSYDGALLRSISWSGAVSGSVPFTYDNDLRLASENGVSFVYDNDGFLVSAGALTLQRNATNGLLTGTTLGSVSDSWTYSELGEVMSYSASRGGASLLSFNYMRDAAGRITSIESRSYAYDNAGRLFRVTDGGTPVAEFEYDANGNRLVHRYPGGTNEATYDDQDRLLTYGGVTYDYTADGELKSKTVAGDVTSYDYDVLGNLRKVVLPGNRTIEYLIDGENRRVGKQVDGAVVQAWLYADGLRIVAELDGANSVVSRFVYGTQTSAPDYMLRNGATYRILADHLGSPRLVVNVADGTIAQSITYDEFGRVISDTNPGFQPFGFAGGMYDRDTELVRFGARDYDPNTGRWTNKDPLLFRGGSNLYRYAYGDPVNFIDRDGRIPVPLVTGIIGGAAGGIGNIAMQLWNNRGAGLGRAFDCIKWGDVGIAAGTGFLAGAAAPFTAVSWLGAIGTSALANEVQYVATEASHGNTPQLGGALWSVGTGATAGAVGGKFSPVSAGYDADSVITSEAQRKLFKTLNDDATNASQVASENLLRNMLGNVAAGAPTPGGESGGCGCP